MAATGYDPQRRSLQQDSRPTPSHGNYPRRRSLQVEDWRAAPNPFARTSDTLGAAEASTCPVPLQVRRVRGSGMRQGIPRPYMASESPGAA